MSRFITEKVTRLIEEKVANLSNSWRLRCRTEGVNIYRTEGDWVCRKEGGKFSYSRWLRCRTEDGYYRTEGSKFIEHLVAIFKEQKATGFIEQKVARFIKEKLARISEQN